jgi:hypothetical protein
MDCLQRLISCLIPQCISRGQSLRWSSSAGTENCKYRLLPVRVVTQNKRRPQEFAKCRTLLPPCIGMEWIRPLGPRASGWILEARKIDTGNVIHSHEECKNHQQACPPSPVADHSYVPSCRSSLSNPSHLIRKIRISEKDSSSTGYRFPSRWSNQNIPCQCIL